MEARWRALASLKSFHYKTCVQTLDGIEDTREIRQLVLTECFERVHAAGVAIRSSFCDVLDGVVNTFAQAVDGKSLGMEGDGMHLLLHPKTKPEVLCRFF